MEVNFASSNKVAKRSNEFKHKSHELSLSECFGSTEVTVVTSSDQSLIDVQNPILKGPRGPKGYPGDNGMPGIPGPAGPQGNVGPTGKAGPRGIQGEVGVDGPIGFTGPKGDIGPTGAPCNCCKNISFGKLISTPGSYELTLSDELVIIRTKSPVNIILPRLFDLICESELTPIVEIRIRSMSEECRIHTRPTNNINEIDHFYTLNGNQSVNLIGYESTYYTFKS